MALHLLCLKVVGTFLFQHTGQAIDCQAYATQKSLTLSGRWLSCLNSHVQEQVHDKQQQIRQAADHFNTFVSSVSRQLQLQQNELTALEAQAQKPQLGSGDQLCS